MPRVGIAGVSDETINEAQFPINLAVCARLRIGCRHIGHAAPLQSTGIRPNAAPKHTVIITVIITNLTRGGTLMAPPAAILITK